MSAVSLSAEAAARVVAALRTLMLEVNRATDDVRQGRNASVLARLLRTEDQIEALDALLHSPPSPSAPRQERLERFAAAAIWANENGSSDPAWVGSRAAAIAIATDSALAEAERRLGGA